MAGKYIIVIRDEGNLGSFVSDVNGRSLPWTDEIGLNETRSLEECQEDRQALLESGIFEGIGPEDVRIWDEEAHWFADE